MGAGEKMTSDPISEAFVSFGYFVIPTSSTGVVQYYAGKGGYANYFDTHSQGYAYTFELDFDDGEFTGCLYFSLGNKPVGIFNNQFARVNWASNTVKTGTAVAYNKVYTGIQSVTISMEGVYADEEYTTPVGLLYTLTIGTDVYKLYCDDAVAQYKKMEFSNYTNEDLKIYSTNYVERDENGVPVMYTYAEENLVLLENMHWGQRTAAGYVVTDPIFETFGAKEKYVIPMSNSGVQPSLTAADSSMGGVIQQAMSEDYGYKFRMDFMDGGFTGCLYFQVHNAWVGIYSDKVASIKTWATNTADMTFGRYAMYNKTYTGIQDISISYRNVFQDEQKVGVLYTLTIGEDKYTLYFESTGTAVGRIEMENYTNIPLYLYAWGQKSYVEKVQEFQNSVNFADYYSEQISELETFFAKSILEAPHYLAEDYNAFLEAFDKILNKEGMDTLKAEIPNIKATLQDKVKETDYYEVEWANVQVLIQEIFEELDSCTSVEMVDNCLVKFEEQILLIRTKAVYARINEHKASLTEFANNAKVENYTSEDYQKIGEICEIAKASLDEAITLEEVDNIYYEAYLALVSLPNIEVENYKEAQVTQLRSFYSETNYDSETWLEIQSVLDAYEAAIYACTDLENIDTCVTLAKKQLDEFITLAELEELTNKKNAAILELNAYCEQKNYDEENWKAILAIIQSATSEINNCETVSEIDEKLAVAKSSLDAVEKVENTPSNESGCAGCSGSLLGNSFSVIVTLLGMAIMFSIRKRKQYH